MRNPFDNEERKAFRDTIRKYCETEIEPNIVTWDEAGAYPHEINEQFCQLGIYGFAIPEEFGGNGIDDQFMRKDAATEMGRTGAGGLMASVGSRSIMMKPLFELANDEIKSRALPELLSGRKAGALGITEPGGGSDVANMKTHARLDATSG